MAHRVADPPSEASAARSAADGQGKTGVGATETAGGAEAAAAGNSTGRDEFGHELCAHCGEFREGNLCPPTSVGFAEL